MQVVYLITIKIPFMNMEDIDLTLNVVQIS